MRSALSLVLVAALCACGAGVPPACPQPTLSEDFSTTANRFSVSGLVQWNGGAGATLTAILPTELIGAGAFGALNFAAGAHTLDTGMVASVGFAQGVWDTTSVTVASGAVVRIIGTGTGNASVAPAGWMTLSTPTYTLTRGELANKYPAHIRCLGVVVIDGQLDGNAGTNGTSLFAYGAADQGPRQGGFNNGGLVSPDIVAGGTGGPGGGEGGRGSMNTALRPPRGELGYGAPVAGIQNTGPASANTQFGGGNGGSGGFRFPSGGVAGEIGGLGGAGGSAYQSGAGGGPYSIVTSGCQQFAPTTGDPEYMPALPSGPPAAFAMPIAMLSAGSGGGAGGDHWEINGPALDDQGGGGGGGGGGLRISAVGNITVGPAGIISMNGANGANGNVFFAGHGGGGSGGEIWLQSFGEIIVANSATLTVNAGAAPTTCSDQGAGAGGRGLYQLEDADGVMNTAFIGGSPTNGNIAALQFPYASTLSGTATSQFFDLGHSAPDLTALTAQFALGDALGAAISITFQGAHEMILGGGPDPTTISAPVSAADFNQLDGHRFIRFTATLSYSAAALQQPMPLTLPSVTNISIAYSTPCW